MPLDVPNSAPHQIAQSGPAAGGVPIGRVDTITGPVTAQHVDGTVVTLEQGASVYQKDLISAKAGAKVALVFVDKTTFALGESGQLRLDELVYNPAGKDGKIALSMLKGAFAFVSGDIAGTQADAMTVRTPVGTIGIRGTAVAGTIDPTGGGTTIAAVPDPSGAPSIISFTNAGGTRVFTENSMITVQSFFAAPSTAFSTAGQNLGEAASLSQVAGSIAQTVNPGGSSPSGPAAAGSTPAPAPAAGAQGAEAGGPAGGAAPSGTIHVTVVTADAPAAAQAANFLALGPTLQDNTPPPLPSAPPPPPPPHPTQDHAPVADGIPLTKAPAVVPNQGTLGADKFSELPAGSSTLFDFATVPNSLQSGDQVTGGAGNDTVSATFTQPISIDQTLTVTNVRHVELQLAGGPSSLDAAGITTTASLPSGSPDSTIVVTGSGALTITDLRVNLDASAATDPLNVSAAGNALSISGGAAGNDTITATGDRLTIFGGAGNDSITVTGNSPFIDGGAGNDMIKVAGNGAFINTGAGDSTVIAGGDQLTIVGGAGNDSITAVGHGLLLSGGAGNDTIVTSSGNDSVSTSGSSSSSFAITTVSGGAGNNLLIADGQATLDYSQAPGMVVIDFAHGMATNGFGGTDTIAGITSGSQGFSGVIGNGATMVDMAAQSFVHVSNVQMVHGDAITGGDVLVLDTPSAIMVDHIAVLVGSTGDDAITDAGVSNGTHNLAMLALGGGGGDTLTALDAGHNDTLNGFAAVHYLNQDDPTGANGDRVTLSGIPSSGTAIDFAPASNGHNVLMINGAGATVVTVSGADTVLGIGAAASSTDVVVTSLGSSFDADFSANAGTNTLALDLAGAQTLTLGSSAGIGPLVNVQTLQLLNGGGSSYHLTFDRTVPALTVDATAVPGGLVLDISAENVPITVMGTAETIIGGAGDDAFALVGNTNSLRVGSGNDTIAVTGDANTVVFGTGNDMVAVTGNNNFIQDNAAPVGNSLTISGNNNTLVLSGHDTISFMGSADTLTVSVPGSFGDDAISIVGGSDLVAFTGNGDTITLGVSSGNDTLVVNGSHDTVTVDLTGNALTLALTASGDTITINNNGVGNAVSLSGTGDPLTINHLAANESMTLFADGLFFASVNGANDVTSIVGTQDQVEELGASDTMVVSGGDDSVYIGLGPNSGPHTDTIDMSGNHDQLFIGSDDTITATLTGLNDTINLVIGVNTTLNLPGSNEQLTVAVVGGNGSHDAISLGGSHDHLVFTGASQAFDALVAGSGDVLTLVSGGDTINASGSHEAFTIDVPTPSVTEAIALPLPGTDDAITLNSSANDLITIYPGVADTLILAGTSDTVQIVNFNNVSESIAVSGTGESVTVQDNQTLASNDAITVSGNHDTVTDVGSLPGSGNDTVVVSGNDDVISLAGNGNLVSVIGGSSSISASGGSGNTLSFNGASSGYTIDLSMGTATNGTVTDTVSGFDHVIGSPFGDVIQGNGRDTITGGAGADTLIASSSTVPGANDNFNYVATTDSYSTATAMADGQHTDVIVNFQDTNSTIDLTQLAGAGTETFVGMKTGADFMTAFGSDTTPGATAYAIIGGNTFVHVAGAAGGYSAGDLLIELQGAHTLTGSNLHLHGA